MEKMNFSELVRLGFEESDAIETFGMNILRGD